MASPHHRPRNHRNATNVALAAFRRCRVMTMMCHCAAGTSSETPRLQAPRDIKALMSITTPPLFHGPCWLKPRLPGDTKAAYSRTDMDTLRTISSQVLRPLDMSLNPTPSGVTFTKVAALPEPGMTHCNVPRPVSRAALLRHTDRIGSGGSNTSRCLRAMMRSCNATECLHQYD